MPQIAPPKRQSSAVVPILEAAARAAPTGMQGWPRSCTCVWPFGPLTARTLLEGQLTNHVHRKKKKEEEDKEKEIEGE